MRFPITLQLGARDCGPSCLKMVADHYGQHYALDFLRQKSNIGRTGVSLLGISEAAKVIGFESTGVKLDTEQLKDIVQDAPVILHWREKHFVVVYKTPKPGRRGHFHVADPALGRITYTEDEFIKQRVANPDEPDLNGEPAVTPAGQAIWYGLVLETTETFYDAPISEGLHKPTGISGLWKYFTPHSKTFFKLLLAMVVGSGILMATPFLTQALVDRGINKQDIQFIYLLLLGQLVLFAGTALTDIIRSYLLLHMGTRINIKMVSDFLKKMLNLPIAFFERHIAGDLMQRMGDHHRIENLLTVSSLNTVFSLLNFAVLSVVLAIYSGPIFALFIIGSALGFTWTLSFLRKRKRIDYKFFELYSKESNKVIEMIYGMPDIKISNSMQQKREEWEVIQQQLYKVKIKSLAIAQYQNIGSSVLRQVTSILITFLAATSVMNGNITLGTMFAITMIVGQLSSPLEQLRALITSWQDARLGLQRINDVMTQPDEDAPDANLITDIPSTEDITLENVSFGYGGNPSDFVLKDISLNIPAGKVTAIVGASGSGKTTLMKLLLRFYDPGLGSVSLGKLDFKRLHHGYWRGQCGVVMQDGQLFSGTIADNIALGSVKNHQAIVRAARIACIDEFISSMPLGYRTEVGDEGTAVSMGQVQRILLARAVYKNPSYLFLDEATSSLDAENERQVIENLNHFFEGRTVVIVAHRLSTVRNADQLIVLEKGEVVDIGSHLDLTSKKGAYYSLVKNQLELGE